MVREVQETPGKVCILRTGRRGCQEQASRYKGSGSEAQGGDRKDVLYYRLRFYVFLAMTI